MYSVRIIGKPNCGKCEDVKARLFMLRDLGYHVEYRHATAEEIKSLELTTAPAVVILDHDGFMLNYFSIGLTYDNVLRHLEG